MHYTESTSVTIGGVGENIKIITFLNLDYRSPYVQDDRYIHDPIH